MRHQGERIAERSLLAAGAAVISAAAVVLAPPLRAPVGPEADPATHLIAAAAPLDPDPWDVAAATAAASSIGAQIENLYLALEPWAQYGANLLSWAVGWIPFAGLLAPQINFFYSLNEAIVQSLVFNTADLLDGTVDASQALSNINAATSAAFDTFFNTETSWIQGLLPPPPPSLLPPPPPTTDPDGSTLAPAVAGADGVAEPTAGALPDPGGLPDPGALTDLAPDPGAALLSLVP